jgi:putative oxidoreductase
MRYRSMLFGGRTFTSPAADAALAVLRVAAGLLLAFLHGLNKILPQEGFIGWIGGMGFPAPVLFAWLAGLAEFGGGLLLALGLLTRPVAAVLIIHFLVVVFVAHAGDSLGDRELAILFGVIALQFLLTGPGRYSIDAVIAGDRHAGDRHAGDAYGRNPRAGSTTRRS